jgi:hypothetical protein
MIGENDAHTHPFSPPANTKGWIIGKPDQSGKDLSRRFSRSHLAVNPITIAIGDLSELHLSMPSVSAEDGKLLSLPS